MLRLLITVSLMRLVIMVILVFMVRLVIMVIVVRLVITVSLTISSISGGRISIKVLEASFLIELFLIGPRGRSEKSPYKIQFVRYIYIVPTSISHEGKLIDGPDDLLHVVLVVRARDQLLQRVQLGGVHLNTQFSLDNKFLFLNSLLCRYNKFL